MALLKKHFRPTYDSPSTRLPTQVQKMVDAPRNFRRVHPFIELFTHADPSRYFLKINISEMLNRKQETLELCALMLRHVGLNPCFQLGRKPPKHRRVILKLLPDIQESSIRFRRFFLV